MAEGQVLVFDGWDHLLAYLAAILAKKVLLGQKMVFLHCWEINISRQFLQKQVEVPGLSLQADKHQPLPNPNPQLHLLADGVKHGTPKTRQGQATLDHLKVLDGIPPPPHDMKKWTVIPAILKVTSWRLCASFTV